MDTSTEIDIPVPWGRIAGKQWGNPNHQKVLAIHGKQDNCGVFDRLVHLLRANYFIIAIDLPGHGFSSHFPSGFPIYFLNYVMAVKRVVDHIQWDSFYYLGHSLGGQIGLFLSSLFPNCIIKMIIIDHLSPEYTSDGNVLKVLRQNINDFIIMEGRVKNGKPPIYTYEESVKKMITRESSLSKEAAEIVLKRSLVSVDDNGYLLCMDQRIKLNPFPVLTFSLMKEIVSSIKCPSLIILSTGRLNLYKHIFSDLFQVYKNCKNFSFKIVEGNHDVHQNDPERVATLIDQFFIHSCKL